MIKRGKRGAILPLIIVSTMILATLGVGIFFLVQLLGGEREFQNAIDSGNLNIAKQALAKKIELSPGLSQVQFAALGPTDTSIDLNTYNRASAVALMVAANTRAMSVQGVALPTATSRAREVQTEWSTLSSRLADLLTSKASFDNSNDFTGTANDFTGTANSNSTRMLNAQSTPSTTHTAHTVAFSERGSSTNATANLGFQPGQLLMKPSSVDGLLVPLLGQQFPKGYLPFDFQAAGSIFFVPLKQTSSLPAFKQSQPHLISGKTFQSDSRAVPGWAKPVPNAFLSSAESPAQQTTVRARLNSCALSQSVTPGLGFKAQIPHGFIRITNERCSSPNSMATAGEDIYTFLMNTPLVGSTGSKITHFDFAPGGNLDAIIARNLAGQKPNPTNCNALTPAANKTECELITGKSAPITNNTPMNPAQLNVISSLYGVAMPGSNGQTALTGCLHAAELANQQFLSQRASGKSEAKLSSPTVPVSLTSGVAKVMHGRGPFGGACNSFVLTQPAKMSELIPEGSAIYKALVQRCLQINPDFSGDLNSIEGWNSLGIPQGARLFIFFNGQVDQRTGAILGGLKLAMEADAPSFLTASIRSTPVDGRTALHIAHSEPINNFADINHAGDCGYPMPYDFYVGTAAQMCVRDAIEYIPCTGYQGLLGEINMRSCFGNNNCSGTPTSSEGVGPASSDCTVDGSAFWEGPC